jgi:uncharacterized phage protein gp47/JayE
MTLPTDPNISMLTQAGLLIESNPNLVAFLISAMQSIYGADINVDSNSPDGQLIQIFAQADTDVLELLLATYNLMAVPTSYGTRLDQLVALNGLARQQGTYTLAKVVVTVTVAQTIPGLDQTAVPAFTVQDSAGNQYQLLTSYVAGAPGTPTLTFQAVTIGQVQTSANTITTIVTSTLGITTVNNPSVAADIIGINEETDAQLKVRHAQSFNIASTGPSDSMEGALKNVSGIVDAYVVENNTGSIVNTIPANSVWPIVNGGIPISIAEVIYAKKSPGCGLKGAQAQIVTRPDGSTFTAQWDNAISQTLYVKFSIIWRGATAMSNADIEAALEAALPYKLGQNPSIGDVVTAMQTIAPTAIVTINSSTQGVSVDNSTWESLVTPTDAQHYFGTVSVTIV